MKPTGEAHAFAGHLLERIGQDATVPPAVRSRIEARGGAAAVLAPAEPDAVAEVLGVCSAEGWPVRIAGSGTALRGGALRVGERAPVVLSTARLVEVTEHEPADLVVGCRLGLPLATLAERLAAAGQWLPLDPPGQPDATVGACIATGGAGPLRAKHGTPRDMVLGLEVVTGDGRRLKFGGRVVKNVAGYDVVRLLVGGGGRLGVLTHAFLRLRGLPAVDRTFLVATGPDAGGARAAAELALAVRNAITADALEVLSPGVDPRHPEGWVVAVRVLGSAVAVDEAGATIRSVAAGRTVEDAPGVWSRLAASEAGADAVDSRVILPGAGPDALATVAARTMSGPWRLALHAGDGVLRAWRTGGADPSPLRDLPHPPVAGPRLQQLTSQLYAAFDPAGILQDWGSRPDGRRSADG